MFPFSLLSSPQLILSLSLITLSSCSSQDNLVSQTSSSPALIPPTPAPPPLDTNNNSTCSFHYTMTKCEPFKTFRLCHNRECLCPLNLTRHFLPANLTINTYWDGGRRECVTHLGSACFITPPPILVSQPYRCVLDNSICLPARDNPRGIGVCKCAPDFAPNARGECQHMDGWSWGGRAKPKSPPSLRPTLQGNPQKIQRCNWKFQCPHVQECSNGICQCPNVNDFLTVNYLPPSMLWDEEESQCVSLAGSYCHVPSQSQRPDDHPELYDRISMSSLGVRCAPGLECVEERGGLGGIGICNLAHTFHSQQTLYFTISFSSITIITNFLNSLLKSL